MLTTQELPADFAVRLPKRHAPLLDRRAGR